MYLEKLEIQGFKSFANKNVLVFPGMLDQTKRGITAVVGPNGSGKSNVADAVRWALGEQSMKTLRGKKSEDVIFSGSDKKGRLGMAEVSLYLNNEDGKAPIDYSQVLITRRLYRNGDSEYMLNNNRVRLSDIQMLLAKAHFGQKTYSVIGQGMVEGFLNTSLAERKEFFDEATGVKQYQIKRDDSLNKLRSSYENLIQAQMLLSEIEPRLKSLTRQVNRLQRRGEIESELKELQTKYYSRLWHEINNKFSEYNSRFLELEKVKLQKDKKLDDLNGELEKMKNEGNGRGDFMKLQEELAQFQAEKDTVGRKLAKLEAQMEVQLEAHGQFDLSFLLAKKEELVREQAGLAEEIKGLEINIASDKEAGEALEKERAETDRRIASLNDEISLLGQEADKNGLGGANERLSAVLEMLVEIEAEEDITKIRQLAQKIKNELEEILALAAKDKSADKNTNGGRWQELHGSLNKLSQEKESNLSKISDNKLRISARTERTRLLRDRQAKTKEEIIEIEAKLSRQQEKYDAGTAGKEYEGLKNKLREIESKLKNARDSIGEASAAEERARQKLFALQKNIHELQMEVNALSNELNELKIGSTRYETKLEDLEIEIRQELGGLKDVKQEQEQAENEPEDPEIKGKIGQLKHQLELIGGIDPQVEKEYGETKERYDFLFGQVSDLTKTIDSLEKVIKELDGIIKERFDKEFKLIEEKFTKYFKILFNGGHAKIIKVMDIETEEKEDKEEENNGDSGNGKEKVKDDKLEMADLKKIKFLQKHNATGLAGIEIQATPPGKKIQSIAMLSGGERALTAIALICAIISSNPSPFVVLDEVDAALDEANSERLAKILEELSHKTQFIVITHNRASMRRANILYGVTMGDDGVSKLLSVKLEDAKIK